MQYNHEHKGMDLSVVIPAYNEADTIESTLRELITYLASYPQVSLWEIIVIDDGSSDDTPEKLGSLSKEIPNLRVINLGGHFGRGVALRKGLEQANGNIIVSLDADLSYAPYHIGRLVEAMREQHADLVLASAYCRQGSVRNVPFNRYAISWLGNKILSYMFGSGINTLTCLVRAYRHDFIKKLDLHSNDKEIHLEIIYKTKVMGGKILEVPGDLCWRTHKLGKLAIQKSPLRRSTLKFRRTSMSHFFFALISRPSLLFWIPGYLLILASLIVFSNILMHLVSNYHLFFSLYLTVRDSMTHAAPSWITMISTFLLGIQFFSLGFISAQNKHIHEEHYRTLNAIYNRLQKDEDAS